MLCWTHFTNIDFDSLCHYGVELRVVAALEAFYFFKLHIYEDRSLLGTVPHTNTDVELIVMWSWECSCHCRRISFSAMTDQKYMLDTLLRAPIDIRCGIGACYSRCRSTFIL